jgi:hypothetical protein
MSPLRGSWSTKTSYKSEIFSGVGKVSFVAKSHDCSRLKFVPVGVQSASFGYACPRRTICNRFQHRVVMTTEVNHFLQLCLDVWVCSEVRRTLLPCCLGNTLGVLCRLVVDLVRYCSWPYSCAWLPIRILWSIRVISPAGRPLSSCGAIQQHLLLHRPSLSTM